MRYYRAYTGLEWERHELKNGVVIQSKHYSAEVMAEAERLMYEHGLEEVAEMIDVSIKALNEWYSVINTTPYPDVDVADLSVAKRHIRAGWDMRMIFDNGIWIHALTRGRRRLVTTADIAEKVRGVKGNERVSDKEYLYVYL